MIGLWLLVGAPVVGAVCGVLAWKDQRMQRRGWRAFCAVVADDLELQVIEEKVRLAEWPDRLPGDRRA